MTFPDLKSFSTISKKIMIRILLVICIMLFAKTNLVSLTDISINVTVMEEMSPEIVFFSLKSVLKINSLMADDILFLNRHPLIDVKSNGDIVFRNRVDLETICSLKQFCCGALTCVIKISIPFKNRLTDILIDSVNLDLEIIDKNDNKPQFAKDKVELSFMESAKIGHQLPLESAVDHDFSSINRIHEYRLVEHTNTFHLKIEKDKSNNLILHLNKYIDYESIVLYQMYLSACDPDFCANQTIVVHVQDENDNVPKFEISFYNISINETFPIDKRILKLNANDLDKSINYSTVEYYIDSKTADLNVLSTYNLDKSSGILSLKEMLNAKIRSQYTFQVVARDSKESGNRNFATVSIIVIDENNNSPMIDILYPNSRQIHLLENQPHQQIAILTITDNDLGTNSLTTCELKESKDSKKFTLQTKSRDLYSIHSLKQFDYETEQICFLQIQCHDFGSPSLTTLKSLSIFIIDENEYSPEFTQLHYRAYVKENMPPHTPLMQIISNDKDKNATLRYNFDNHTENLFLKIDTINGWISTSEVNIDREKINQISRIVYVTDTLGSDAKTASVSVFFQITDENDNKPMFTETFSFKISENILINTFVGQVWAIDADEGGTAVLQFSLLKTWSSRQREVENLFLIKSNGIIETKGEIDRELDDSFTLLIEVSDEHFLNENRVTTNITVNVIDENDNKPIWVLPSHTNQVINITKNFKVGDEILQLLATDADIANNGRLQYYLSQNDPEYEIVSKFFLVNSSTGRIFVLHQLLDAKYRLSLEVADFGEPSLRTSTILFLRVYGQISQTLKIAVVASIITVTGVISVFLIIAIICVRKHPNQRSQVPSETNTAEKDDSYLKLKSSLNYVSPTPDFLTLLGSKNINSSVQAPMLSSGQRRTSEYLDADSGDSGRGPSEEGLSSHYMNDGKVFLRSMNQSGINYSVSPFIQSNMYPHSCFSLPENAVISPISDDMLIGNSYYDLSSSNNRNLTGLYQKIPSMITDNGEYPMQNLYSQLSQI